MKDIKTYIIEKEQFNQSDEDYFVTMLTWQCDDGGDWTDKNEKYFKHCCDNPLILCQMYVGEDHYYDNAEDVDISEWDSKEKIIDKLKTIM